MSKNEAYTKSWTCPIEGPLEVYAHEMNRSANFVINTFENIFDTVQIHDISMSPIIESKLRIAIKQNEEVIEQQILEYNQNVNSNVLLINWLQRKIQSLFNNKLTMLIGIATCRSFIHNLSINSSEIFAHFFSSLLIECGMTTDDFATCQYAATVWGELLKSYDAVTDEVAWELIKQINSAIIKLQDANFNVEKLFWQIVNESGNEYTSSTNNLARTRFNGNANINNLQFHHGRRQRAFNRPMLVSNRAMSELADYNNDNIYTINHTNSNEYVNNSSNNIYSINRSSDSNDNNSNTNMSPNQLHHSPSSHNPQYYRFDALSNNEVEVMEQSISNEGATVSERSNVLREEEINVNRSDELFNLRQETLYFVFTFFHQLREYLLRYKLQELEYYMKFIVVLLLRGENHGRCLIERNVRIAAGEALTVMLELAYKQYNTLACQEWQKLLLTQQLSIIRNAERKLSSSAVSEAHNDIHCALLTFNALLTASMEKESNILEVNWSTEDRELINHIHKYVNKNLENQSLSTDIRHELFTSLPLLAACNAEYFNKNTVPELPKLFRVVFTCANEKDERAELFRILPLLFKAAPTLLTHKYEIIVKQVSVLTPCIRLIMSYIDQTLYIYNTEMNKSTIEFTANHTVFLSALACFSLLADDFREEIRPYVQLLLESVIRNVITPESTHYLINICKIFPELRSKCLKNVLDQIKERLMNTQYAKQERNIERKVKNHPEELQKGCEAMSVSNKQQQNKYEYISQKHEHQNEIQLQQEEEEEYETSEEQQQKIQEEQELIINNLQILGSYDFANYSILSFLCETLLMYTTHRCEQIRQYAIALCIKLVFSDCVAPLGVGMHSEQQCIKVNHNVVHGGTEHIQLINKVITRLVESAVADSSYRIRLYIIKQFNTSFDVFIASTRNIHCLQLALFNSYKEKLLMIKLLGRLTIYNRNSIEPILNTVLTQTVASMQYSYEPNEQLLEETWWTLSSLLDAAPTIVQPYHSVLLASCNKNLQQYNSHTSLLAALLSCVGKLTQLASLTNDAQLICSLEPQIVEWIVHSESLLIKQEAIRALTHVIRFTKKLDVYKTNPCLFNVLTSLLRTHHDKTFTMQTDILRLIGCIGAIAPAEMKEIVNVNELSNAKILFVKTPECTILELQKWFEKNQREILLILGENYREKGLCQFIISEILLVLTDVTLTNNKIYINAIVTMKKILSIGDSDGQLLPSFVDKIVNALLNLAEHRKEISYFAIMETAYYIHGCYWPLESHVKSIVNKLIHFISTENKANCLVAAWHVLTELRYRLSGHFKQYVLASVQSTINVADKLENSVLSYSLIFIIALASLLKDVLYLVIPWIINVLNNVIKENVIIEDKSETCSTYNNRITASKHTFSCCKLAINAIACIAITETDFVFYAPRCLWCLNKLLTVLRERHSSLLHHNTAISNESHETELKELSELNTATVSTYNFIADEYSVRNFPKLMLSFQTSPSSSSSTMYTKSVHGTTKESINKQMEGREEQNRITNIYDDNVNNNHHRRSNSSSTNQRNGKNKHNEVYNTLKTYNETTILEMLQCKEKLQKPSLLENTNRRNGDLSDDTCVENCNDMYRYHLDDTIYDDVFEYGNINSRNNNSRTSSSVKDNLLFLLNDAASWATRMSHPQARKWLYKVYLSIIQSNPFILIQQTYELARIYETFAKRLCNVAFAVLHRERISRGEERYVQKVNSILTNSHVSVVIIQALLNLAEFMERIKTGYSLTFEPSNLQYNYPFDINALITASKRCRWYFKTIHYEELKFQNEKYRLEREHLIRDTHEVSEEEKRLVKLRNKCIELYNLLGYNESAEGMQTYLEQNFCRLVNNVNAKMIEINNSSLLSKLRCWSQSVSTDFEKQERHSSSKVQRKVQQLRELDNMGKYNELLNVWKSLQAGIEQNDIKELAPYGAYAAWLLRSWDDLEIASKLMPNEGYFNVTATFYKATLAVRNKEDSNISQCLINECRRGLNSSISMLLTESYDRAYALFVGLQQLSELEEYNLAMGDVYSKAHWKELWERRLTSMRYDGWPGTLANHTLLLAPTDELSVWLQFVCLSRLHNKPAIGKTVLSDLLHNKPIEDIITSSKTFKQEKISSISPLPQIALAAVEHEYWTGNRSNAINLLKNYIEVNQTFCDTFFNENINNVEEKCDKLESACVTALACCYAQLAWWMCLERESISEYDSNYNSHPNCISIADTINSEQHIHKNNVDLFQKTIDKYSSINKLTRMLPKEKMEESKEFAKQIMEYCEYATRLDLASGSIWHTVAETSNKLVSLMTTHLSNKLKLETQKAITESLMAQEQRKGVECEEEPRSDEYIHPYVLQAANNYLKSIQCNEKLEDVLSFLSLWFEHTFLHQMSDKCQELWEKVVKVKPSIWCKAIPQLVARVCGQEVAVCESVKKLLVHVAETYPQALLYSLSIYENNTMENNFNRIASTNYANTHNDREKAANDILTAVSEFNKSNSILIDETRLVSRELVRCSMLWYEIWLDKISGWMEEFRTTEELEMFVHRLKSISSIFTAPETEEEKYEMEEYGKSLFNFCNSIELPVWRQKFIKIGEELWEQLKKHLGNIEEKIIEMNHLSLKKVSPKLQECGNNLSIVIPGQFNTEHVFPRINKINEYIPLINSKQHPRKVEITGDDGERYLFLLKGHEDLRLDERVMQLLNLVNNLINERTNIRRLESVIQTYSVTPLNSSAGLIGWVHRCNSLHNLIVDHRENNKNYLQREQEAIWRYFKTEKRKKLSRIHCAEAFEWAINSTPGDDLAKSMWLSSINTNMWLEHRTTYTCSLATMSMVGYILGLGDRHLENIMLHNATGRIVHIDYGDCFDVARTREFEPEFTPFRLTRILRNAMEVCDYEGLFKHNCVSIMNMLHEESDKILIVLQTFVHDPLVGWEVNKPRVSKEYKDKETNKRNEKLSENFQEEECSATADAIIRTIKGKLKGAVYKNEMINQSLECQKAFDVDEQVRRLINEATDFENLSIQYEGLRSYW